MKSRRILIAAVVSAVLGSSCAAFKANALAQSKADEEVECYDDYETGSHMRVRNCGTNGEMQTAHENARNLVSGTEAGNRDAPHRGN